MRTLPVLLVLLVFVSLLAWTFSYSYYNPTHALDSVDALQREIDELEKLKKLSEDATTPLEAEVRNLDNRIRNAQAGIVQARQDAEALAVSIEEREQELGEYYVLFMERVRSQYKQLRLYSPLVIVAGTFDAGEMSKRLAYHSSIRDQNEELITEVTMDILQLEEDKKELEERQVLLAGLQVQLDAQAEFFKEEIAKAREYQQVLGQQIAELNAKQQAILAARTGSFKTSLGDVPLADDFNASIGFKAQAPSNSFAVFSFGAYTHRNGMSQYGARERADQGQSVEDILKAYYPDATLKKDYDVMGQITVDGTGTIPFEDHYLHGIYEVPESWPPELLKAQAIAARTYAIRRTSNGQNSICATEACQVFKNDPKKGDWKKAVEDTRRWVLVNDDGSPALTQYASTHGGYSNTSGWDTTDKSGEGDWTSRAWDSLAGSPWFYKSWYRSGYSSSGANCGRSHPWLSQEEMSDILNAWIVRKNPNGADAGRIQPITINECNVGGSGGNPYSISELRDKANDSGGAVTSISGVSVSHNNNGQTSQVVFQTNRGSISISGSEFKETFNLRAPGYLRVPQSSFAFFNVEHKQ
ncbi:MAG: SpoIID/LytB domain-containing protein [Patescibacteria group bacterium]